MRSIVALATTIGALAGIASGGLAQTFCSTCKIEKVAHYGGFLEGPSVDAGGRLRVVDFASGDVLEVRDGRCTRIANTGGHANGSRLDAAGTLFVSDAVRGVLKLAADNSFSVEIAPEPGAAGANDLAFDANGGLYFTVPGSSSYLKRTGKVFYRPPGIGQVARLFRDGLAFPNGVAVSADGKYVYVGQFSDKTIVALPSVGNNDVLKGDYVLAHTNGGIGPDGMIVDRRKRLIWANFAARGIGVADENGTMLGNVKLPPEAGTYVTNIAEHDGTYYITEAQKGEVWRLTGLDG